MTRPSISARPYNVEDPRRQWQELLPVRECDAGAAADAPDPRGGYRECRGRRIVFATYHFIDTVCAPWSKSRLTSKSTPKRRTLNPKPAGPYGTGDTVDYFFNHKADFDDDEVFGQALTVSS